MSTVTFNGNTLNLEGNFPKEGQKAPDFVLQTTTLSEKTLADFAGNTLVLCTVPSLDTPVCDMEMRHFNEEASKLSDKCKIVSVSCDLPFALARWSGAAGIKNVETLSAYFDHDFAIAYGVWIKELHLLARAVFVINKDQIITWDQLVPEVTRQPDYDAAIEAIKKTL